MPNFYLLRPNGTFSDNADYPEQPPAREDGEWVQGYPTGLVSLVEREKTFNELLETAFLAILPQHIGQPYLTGEVMIRIGTLKQAVTDFNKLGQYALAQIMIASVALPEEMEADRQSLLNMFPTD